MTAAMSGGSPRGLQPRVTSRKTWTWFWRRSTVQVPPTTAGLSSMASRQSPVARTSDRSRAISGRAGSSTRPAQWPAAVRAWRPSMAVRRAVEPDVPRRPGINGGDGAVAGRIEDDRGGGGGVLHQPTPVQPAAGKATGGHPPATDAEVEGRTGLAHQVAAAHEEQRQRDRVFDRRADRREQRSRVPAPSIPVVDPYPDVPTGQVAEADIDVDPHGPMSNRAGSMDAWRHSPSSPPTWTYAGSKARPGCR